MIVKCQKNLYQMPYLTSTVYYVLYLHASFVIRVGFREISGWKSFIGSGTTASNH